jgi:NAD-dependent deacetylase
MKSLIKQAASAIVRSELTLALTGAGISVESGIPDFRSAGGLWSRYDPAEYATIEAFRRDPEKVWHMLRELEEVVLGAVPNPAHIGLFELESLGYLHCVITQNIDNLHQSGGTANVIEYHGNGSSLSCLFCGTVYPAVEKRGGNPPRCSCGKILKPDVVMFGEAIPVEALNRSFDLASKSEALLVIGTSATVSPANTIPSIAKRNGAVLIEINMERTHLTDSMTDIFLQGNAGTIVKSLVSEVKLRHGAMR